MKRLPNAPSVTQKIASTCHRYKIAPLVLVFNRPTSVEPNGHWVAGTRCDTDKQPAHKDDKVDVATLDVFNPWVAGKIPEADRNHSRTDKRGSGTTTTVPGTKPAVSVYWGPKNHAVSYTQWWSQYLAHPVDFPSKWKTWYIAVCDPEAPPEMGFVPPPLGGAVLPAADVPGLAWQTLADAGLLQRDEWRAALVDVDPDEPVKPELVERLDLPDRDYYVVPLRNKAGQTPVLVNLDAYGRFGLGESTAVPGGTTLFGERLDWDAVLRDVVNKAQVWLHGQPYVLKEEYLYDRLVWQPCLESLSLDVPFYLFNIMGDFKVYLRIDGELFTELHFGIN